MTEPPGEVCGRSLGAPGHLLQACWSLNNLYLLRVGFSSEWVKIMFFIIMREHLTSQEERMRGTQVPSDRNAQERNHGRDVLVGSDS